MATIHQLKSRGTLEDSVSLKVQAHHTLGAVRPPPPSN